MLSNMIMMDGSLAINERGLLVTLYSLPKNWDFSIRGMTKILPNGERAITTALRKLESKRYVKCTYYRDKNGRFKTDIELFYHVKNAKNSGIFAETDNVENLDEEYAFIIALAVVALIGINKAGLFKSNNNETVVSEVNENAPYYEVDENSPVLLKTMNLTQRYISLNPLDDKGRASAAMAILGIEDLQAKYAAPKTEIVPTGFSKAYYYELVNDKSDGSLFVVGKLIPFTELKKENAITQTRYMSENIQLFIDQIKKALEKKLHVIVSVIPEYEGDDVICKTLKYQAYSVEDNGESVSFNMVFNNIQPGIEINYSTGESIKE